MSDDKPTVDELRDEERAREEAELCTMDEDPRVQPEQRPNEGRLRRAIVRGHGATGETIGRYLPANYEVTMASEDMDGQPFVIIHGLDNLGWTLEGYVIPRLASGLYGCKELDG